MVEAACVLIRQLHIACQLLLADRAGQSPPPSGPPPSGSPLSAGAGAGPSAAAGRRNSLIRHRQLRTRDPAGPDDDGRSPAARGGGREIRHPFRPLSFRLPVVGWSGGGAVRGSGETEPVDQPPPPLDEIPQGRI